MKQRGISLVEVLISIAIIGGTIVVFATLFNILKLNKTGSLYTAAYKIAQEELEVIRTIPLSDLTTRTDAPFMNILYNSGTPGVENGALKISPTSTLLGLALLPYNNMTDITLETDAKASSLTNKTGILLRAKDLQNYYFFYIKNDRVSLEKNVNGTITSLYETLQTFNPNTYYKLKAVLTGTNISLYLDDLFLQTIADTSFVSGYAALASLNSPAYFDNVSLTYNSETNFWNFDSLEFEALPQEWKRFGLNDLPSGVGTLSISEPYSNSNIKKIDVSVSWTERDQIKSISLSTLKTE